MDVTTSGLIAGCAADGSEVMIMAASHVATATIFTIGSLSGCESIVLADDGDTIAVADTKGKNCLWGRRWVFSDF